MCTTVPTTQSLCLPNCVHYLIYFLSRHEVWIFVRHGAYRRVMLTDDGKVLEVNSVGEPVSSEATSEELHTQPTKEAPKISLQEVQFY